MVVNVRERGARMVAFTWDGHTMVTGTEKGSVKEYDVANMR